MKDLKRSSWSSNLGFKTVIPWLGVVLYNGAENFATVFISTHSNCLQNHEFCLFILFSFSPYTF